MITFKKPDEAAKMRRAGRVVADIHGAMRERIRPGIDTLSLSDEADRILALSSARSPFMGYRTRGVRTPFPSPICVSINEEVVHGIPSRDRILREGDIVSIDAGAIIDGYNGDAACTYPVGEISPKRAELLRVTLEALRIGIKESAAGRTIGDIGHAIETWVLGNGHGLVREYSGHGIGRKLHEAPQVPNYGAPRSGVTIKPGMTFCIEPMVMNGGEKTESAENGWTVVTSDKSDAAHFEHTLLITDAGAEILTPWE
ncbi:MAG: type I methionyl aminopeptidase [Synergistaceae bacterium]|jgi:methionyl aminopeptidase|nr:type I methionyl aminopeptidase [Synergistaceae bacterium]